MAKKTSNKSVIGLLAFIALAITAICFLLAKLGIGSGVIGIIGSACLLIVVLLVAWDYARTLSKGFRIFYLVLAVCAIVCFILGQPIF